MKISIPNYKAAAGAGTIRAPRPARETPIGEEEDSHLGDFIEDRGVVSPAEAVINLNLKEQTDQVLKTLSPR